jgi:hypothetical protein
LASVIFVAMQLKQKENLLQLEMRNYLLAGSVAVNESIIEHADIWTRGETR